MMSADDISIIAARIGSVAVCVKSLPIQPKHDFLTLSRHPAKGKPEVSAWRRCS